MQTPYSDGVFYANNTKINPFLASCIENISPNIAVDFGCGIGTNSCYLQQHGWEVWVVEREDIAVNVVKASIPHDRIFHNDIREMDFSLLPNFSLAICNYVLQHLALQEAIFFLQKVVNKLPCGGHVVLSIFERENAIDAAGLKDFLTDSQCQLLQEKTWSRWDYDHGPAHFHKGHESFWLKLK